MKFQMIATDLDRIKQHKDDRLCKGEVERIGGEAIVTFQAGQQPRRKFTAPLRALALRLRMVMNARPFVRCSTIAPARSSG